MTLWNPLNVFSSGQASSSDEGPSASFDPSRIGDPLGAPSAGPAVGFGDARIGTAAVGDPRRNPIGFAPPETEAPSRFRTEISFRRHTELPRASAVPAERDDHTTTAWQSPATVEHDDVSPAEEALFVEIPNDTSTPFFRREISFRRKKTMDGAQAAAEDDFAAETTDAAEDHVDAPAEVVAYEPAVEPEIVALPEVVAEAAEWAAPVVSSLAVDADDTDGFDDAVVAEPVTAVAVPFYRRELGFGRSRAAAVDAVAFAVADVDLTNDAVGLDDTANEPELIAEIVEPEARDEVMQQGIAVEQEIFAAEPATPEEHAPDDADVVVEPVAVAAVPFYKRELGFRRKKTVAQEAMVIVAADAILLEDETSDDTTEAAVSADEPFVAWARSDEQAEETKVLDENAAAEEAPVELTEREFEPIAEPAAEIVAVHDLEHEATEHEVVEHEPTAVAEHDADLDASLTDDAPTDDVAADDLPTDEVEGADAVDAPAGDAPDSGGRFGTRKQKAPKQKKQGGAKGRKIVGLKIGASQIAAAVVSETEAGHELVGLARRSLAAGIVVDGEVRDEAALATAIKALFDEEKLPKTDVHIGLSSNRIGVRTLDIDVVEDESRFDNAVRFKAHEVLPVALSESVLDYRVLEERVGEDGQATRRVLLVVAPRDQVEPYQRAAIQAGIKLTAIDLEALGLLRAFVEPGTGVPTPDDTATVVIAIGHESSTLLVSGGGACEFTRVFDWGGGALEEAIATALEVLPAEAATILRHLSLSGPGRQYDSLTEESRAKATDAVRQRLTPFARELVNSLQFYQTQAESLGIGGILVTGGTSHLEGLDSALHQMIGVEVSVGDPFARVIRATEIDPAIEATIGSLAVPIGLAIEDLATRGINLLPKGAPAKKMTSRSTLLSIGVPVAAAIPLAALSFLYLGAHSKAVDNQTQLDAVKAQIATLPPPKAPVIDAGVVGNEAARATAVAQVLGGRLAWDAVFRDLARILPDNVWLSTMQLSQPTTAGANLADGTTAAPSPLPGQAAATPTAVSIDGFTYTQPDVARLLARLATLPSLQRVTLTSSQSQLIGTKPVVHFVIVADLSSTGGAS